MRANVLMFQEVRDRRNSQTVLLRWKRVESYSKQPVDGSTTCVVFKRTEDEALWQPACAKLFEGSMFRYAELSREEGMEVAVLALVPGKSAFTPPLKIVPPWPALQKSSEGREGWLGHKKGDNVKAKWFDGNWYKGKVFSIQEDKTATVKFDYDGTTCSAQQRSGLFLKEHLKDDLSPRRTSNSSSSSASSSSPAASSSSFSASASSASSSPSAKPRGKYDVH